ncbi:MAG: transposase [Bacteroidota bacterium]
MKKLKYVKLECDSYYHIHNRGINSCNLFRENENYEHFLRLFNRYIIPVAKCFAWVLMGNHFHFFVRINKEKDILNYQEIARLSKMRANDRVYQQFSNLFNAYTKAFNKRYDRTGSLFEHPFRRKKVENRIYFQQLVLYIHMNPVNHGFRDHPLEYPWSSFHEFISQKSTNLDKKKVFGWFNKKEDFKAMHDEMVHLVHEEDLSVFTQEII